MILQLWTYRDECFLKKLEYLKIKIQILSKFQIFK